MTSGPIRRLRRLIAMVLAVPLGVVVAALLLVQIDPVGTRVAQTMAAAAAPDGLRVDVERVSGSWLRSLTLVGIRVEDRRSGTLAGLDTLRVRYRPWTWRLHRISLDSAQAAGLSLTVRPPDSVAAAEPVSPSGPAGSPSEPTTFRFSIRSLEIRRGEGVVEYGGGERFRVDSLQARAEQLQLGPVLAIPAWTLRSSFAPAGKDPGWGRVEGTGSFTAALLDLDTLSVTSPRSRVAGSGRIPLDSTLALPGGARWNLEAAPLALADLQGLVRVPAVVEGDSLFLTTRAVPAGDSALVQATLRLGSDADGQVDLRWTGGDGVWGGRFSAGVRGLSLARYLGESLPRHPLNLEVEGGVGMASSDGRVSRLHSDVHVRASAGEDLIRGTVALRRDRTGSAGFRDSLRLDLDRLAWRQVSLLESRAALERTGPRVDWSVDLRPADGGRVTGTGDLTGARGAGPLVYRGDLELRSVMEPVSGSILTGRLRLQGRGTDPERGSAQGVARLDSSRVGSVSLDSAEVEIEWESGEGTVMGWAGGPRGRVGLASTLQVTTDGSRLVIDTLRVDSLRPLPDTRGDPVLEISGSLTGEARWPGGWTPSDPRMVVAALEFRSGPGRLGPMPLDSAWATASWDGGEITARARSHLPDSALVEMDARGTFLDSLSLRLDSALFQGISPKALGLPGPAASLQGRITGTWRGTLADSAPRFDAELVLDRSPLGLDTIRSLTARVGSTSAGIGGQLAAELGGGTLTGSVAGSPGSESPGWEGSVSADLPRIGRFFGRPDTSVSVVARATLSPRRGTQAPAVLVEAFSASGWGARVDTLVAHARLDGDLLALDTLHLRSNVATVDGAGTFPMGVVRAPDTLEAVPVTDSATHRLAIRAVLPDSVETLDLPGVGRVLARNGGLDLVTECGPDRCALEGRAEAGALLLGQMSVASVNADVSAALEPGPTVVDLEAHGDVQGIRTPTARIRSVRLDATVQDRSLSVDASTVVDDLRDAEIGLDADLRPDQQWATVRRVRFRMDEDVWQLTRPATLRWRRAGLSLDSLEVVAGRQRFLAMGTWAGDEGHDFTVQLDSVRVGTLSDVLGAPGLDGWLSATVDGYGTGALPGMEATARGALTYRDRATHRIRVQADLGTGFLALDAQLLDSLDHRRLRAAGEIPVGEGTDTGWQLNVRADSLPLGWIEPYLPADAVRGVRGNLHADLDVRGDHARPTARGPVRVDGGGATLPGLGITLRQARLRATAAERTLTVDTLRVRSDGWARMTGSVSLAEPSEPAELDLDLRMEDFLAINTRMVRSVVSGGLSVGGTAGGPDLMGSVNVREAEIRLDEGLGGGDVEDVTLSEEDWATLQTRFGIPMPEEDLRSGPPLFRQTALDLSVVLGRDIWLRQRVNPEMAVQFTGEVDVAKSAGEDDLRLQGRLEAIPRRSYLEQFGRRFQLEEGTVLLRGAPENTTVQITSIYEVPPRDGDASQVSIRLGLSGEVERLDLTLSSEPSMSNSDIISYLATGRPASEAFSGDGGDSSAAEIGAGVVASQLTGLVEQFAMRDVGLDVVEIQRDGLKGATLVAGRYVTPTLFLGFRQPVSFGQTEKSRNWTGETEAEVEWRAFRWLLLNLETGGSAFRFFLEGSLGY